MLTKKELIDHINETYNLSPEYIFKKFPDYCVFRHQKSKKWFGVLMSVPGEKIYDDASDHRIINILNLKVDPELGGILRGKEGYFPAYHMNKEHWISIDLRKIEKLDELADLIDGSFKSTQ